MIRIPIIAEQLQGCDDIDISIDIPEVGGLEKRLEPVESGSVGTITSFSGHWNWADKPLREFEAVSIPPVYLVWIPERNEWVGIKYSEKAHHFEGERQGIEEDIEASGPYKLDKTHLEIIQKTFKCQIIPPKCLTIPPEQILHLGPSLLRQYEQELKRMAGRIKVYKVEFENGSGKRWKEFYDATLATQPIAAVERYAQDRQYPIVSCRELSPEDVLERLRAGVGSKEWQYDLLRRRTVYWLNYFRIVGDETLTNVSLEKLFELLKFRVISPPKDIGYYEYNDDYEEGYEIRVKAALELGRRKDTRAIPKLEEALYDHGDRSGCSEDRFFIYCYHTKDVQEAAVRALAMIGGEKAVEALERKLRRVGEKCPYSKGYQGVSKDFIINALGKINHPRSKKVLREIFDENYLSNTYYWFTCDDPDRELGLTAAMSLRRLGICIDRVVLDKNYQSGNDARRGGTVVNLSNKTALNIRISTTFTNISSHGKVTPFSQLVASLNPNKRSKFDFSYTEDRWIEEKSIRWGALRIEYNYK